MSPSEPQDVDLTGTQGAALPINLFAVPDFDYQKEGIVVIDGINYPVYALPYAKFVLT